MGDRNRGGKVSGGAEKEIQGRSGLMADYLTVKEVAEACDVSLRTVRTNCCVEVLLTDDKDLTVISYYYDTES